MTWREMEDSATKWIGCAYCAAPAGSFCITASGMVRHPHSVRVRPIQEAFDAGCLEAESDMFDRAVDNPQWFLRATERHRQRRLSGEQ